MDRQKMKLPAYFYKTISRNEPVREWLQSLSREDKKIIGESINRVQFGWPLGIPVVRSLGNSLWEVRSGLSDKKIARIIFFMHSGAMVLLNGLMKKAKQISYWKCFLPAMGDF